MDIHDLYSSSKIFGVIIFVMLGWAGVRGIYTREDKCMQGLVGRLNGKRPFWNSSVQRKIILHGT